MKTLNSKNIFVSLSVCLLSMFASLGAFSAPKINSISSTKTNFNFNSFMASQFQQKTSQIKKPEDVRNKFLSTRSQKTEFDQWHKKNPFKVPAMNIKRKGTQVYLATKLQKVIVDFRSYDQKKIFINNVGVKLSDKKTFDDYKNEVTKILKTKKSALNIFFSEAIAQETEEFFFAPYIAWYNVGYRVNNITVPWAESYISAVIRGAYQEEQMYLMNGHSSSSPGDRNFNWRTLDFECTNQRVSRVGVYEVISNNRTKESYIPGTPNIVKTADGFKFTFSNMGNPVKSCESILDASGVVISKSGDIEVLNDCPSEGTNVFEEDSFPFGEFPLAADLCCKRQGCYEEVINDRNILRDRLLGTYKPGQEGTDSGGASNSDGTE